MVSAAFHGALRHSDVSFVIWETLNSYVAHYLDGTQGLMSWEAGKCSTRRQCLQIKGAKETVYKMWIQFQARIDDYGSRKPIKLNIHSSNKSDQLTGSWTSAEFPQLFKASVQWKNKAIRDALIPESRLQDGINQRSATTTESSSQATPRRIGLRQGFGRSGSVSSTPMSPNECDNLELLGHFLRAVFSS